MSGAMAVAALLLTAVAVAAPRWRLPAGEEVPEAVDAGLAGSRAGAYRLEAPVGAGVLGEVYLARHTAPQAPRAVKVMKAGPASHPRIREAFLQGARSAARLRHPHIVPVYDCGVESGLPYLVMPYVESLSLEQHLQRLPEARQVGDPTVRRCVREVAAALDHAHAHGVVHGDLRPSNVLVRARDGRTLLGGFAVAPVPAGAPEPTAAGDLSAFAGLLRHLAPGMAPGARHGTASELADAYLAATEWVTETPPEWTGGAMRAALALGTAAILLGTAVVTAAALTAQGRSARAGPAPQASLQLGQPAAAGGLRLTVVDARLDAPAPASIALGPGQRLVVVDVRCAASAAAGASPYDWAITDASGNVYGAVVDGLDGALPEIPLAPNERVRGVVGFVVPRSARGLVLHSDAETGDHAVEVPIG